MDLSSIKMADGCFLDPRKKDSVVPEGKWVFGEEVASCFDNMLSRSIPQYQEMRQLCLDIGSRYVQPDTHIVDLGCSRGEALAPFVKRFGGQNRFVGVEVSQPMLEASKARFGHLCLPDKNAAVTLLDTDLRTGYPMPLPSYNGWSHRGASLTLCVLTLQFIPITYRQKILRNIYKNTEPGGAVILVEKVLGATADIDDILIDVYHDLKKSNGYSQDDIDRKKLSLEGVLVPVTDSWNRELLKNAGFSEVDSFWRWANFTGYIAVKGE